MGLKRICSEQTLEFVIPGRPVCKGTRNSRRIASGLDEGGATTANGYKSLIRMCAKAAIAARGGWEYTTKSAFYVVITIYVGPEGRVLKSVENDMYKGKILPVREPRVDNIATYVMEALLGITWDRKAQVVGLLVAKKYNKTRQSVEVLIGNPKNWRELNNDLRNA